MNLAIQQSSRILAVFLSVLSGTVLLPAVRPLLVTVAGTSEGTAHAFAALAVLGSIIGAPIAARLAERIFFAKPLVVALCLIDASLLCAISGGPPPALLLGLRFCQGAANLGALSLLLGSVALPARADRARTSGGLATAMIAAVAAGAPIGTALLAAGPRAVVLMAAACAALAGLLALPLPFVVRAAGAHGGRGRLFAEAPALRWPMLFVLVERFGVGCFVVTFALHAHRHLGLADAEVGVLYGWFLLPFALAVYPVSALTARLSPRRVAGIGLFVYAAGFAALAAVRAEDLYACLAILGLSSAVIYAPSFAAVAAGAPEARRASAMALLHAAGNFGMLLGTAVAGCVSAVVSRLAPGRDAHVVVFLLAAIAGAATAFAAIASKKRANSENRGNTAIYPSSLKVQGSSFEPTIEG